MQLIREQVNFAQVYEGYPEYLTQLTHGSILDLNRVFKPNKWSQLTGALDFYETLDIINRLHSVIASIQDELYSSLQPWDPSLMAHIDTALVRSAL